MTSHYFSPVILERFNSRQNRGQHRRAYRRKLQQLERSTVLPVDGQSKHQTVGQRMITGEIAIFDDKAANAVLVEAESQLKSGYPTIAASSMIARRSQIAIMDDVEQQIDVKFFSELVKPVPYRWRFQKDKLKTISPSKNGFHQRSNSPTFQRLVKATEKLQKHVNDEELNNVEKTFEEDFFETQSNEWPTLTVKQSVVHPIKFDPLTSRTSQTGSMLKPTALKLQEKYTELLQQDQHDVYIDENDEEEDEDYASKSASSKQLTPVSPPANSLPVVTKKLQQEFKVDFKKLESHSELHLFLPHIHDASSRGETPERPRRKSKITLVLPPIECNIDAKNPEEEKFKSKRRQKNEIRKKKKNTTRVKSGKEEKVVKDTLNDVPTLISLGNDKDFHPASMCLFDNCTKHMHRKSTGIRQT